MDYFTPDTYHTSDNKKVTRVPAEDMKTFYGRAKHLYYIETKDSKLITYQPNQGQKIIGEIIDRETERSMNVRGFTRIMLQVLKPRQIGATTDTVCRIYDMMLRIPRTKALVTNHLGDDTDIIFNKYQVIHRNLPDFIELLDEKGNAITDETGQSLVPLKPSDVSDSAKQIKFSEPLASWVYVRTAGSGDNLGKGGTIQAYHGTETANYQHYNKAVSSTLQQLSDIGETFVVNESTANGTTGPGEGYYKDWIRAEASYKKLLAGETSSHEGYVPVFVPWYVIDEYQLPLQNGKMIDLEGIDFGSPEGKEKFLEKELMLMMEYNVSPERINWYRYIIKTKCGASLAEANRYYPTFPEDAFLSTDKCFFDSTKLFALKKQFDDGTLSLHFEEGYLNEDLEFVYQLAGELRIFQHPDPNSTNRYIISLDTSKGVEEGDYTSMKVFDRLNESWVAHWHGKIAEDLAAKEFIKLCIYYNYGLAIPESNRATVIDLIKPGGYLEYEGEIYYSKVFGDGTYDYGYYTAPGSGATSRKLLLDRHKAWLRDNYDKFNTVEDVEEHLSFVRHVSQRGTVRYEADTGKKDDRVMSMALAITASQWWEEEVGIMNEEKTDYKQIVKITTGRKNAVQGYKQSMLGGQSKPDINKVHKISRKQSSLGKNNT
jgi:hypothetical protein